MIPYRSQMRNKKKVTLREKVCTQRNKLIEYQEISIAGSQSAPRWTRQSPATQPAGYHRAIQIRASENVRAHGLNQPWVRKGDTRSHHLHPPACHNHTQGNTEGMMSRKPPSMLPSGRSFLLACAAVAAAALYEDIVVAAGTIDVVVAVADVVAVVH